MAQAPYRYQRPSTREIDRRAKQRGGDYQGFINDDIKVFSPKKGQNTVRILPPTWEGAKGYGFDVWVHYRIGPGAKHSVLCLSNMRNKPCCICDEAARLDKAGDEDEAGSITAKRRVAVWMIDRNDERSGPQVWLMPWGVDKDVAIQSQDRQSGEYLFIDDPDYGYDVNFDRTGEGKLTKYNGVGLARRSSSVSMRYIDYIRQHPLPELLVWRDNDELAELIGASAGGGGGERDERPRGRGGDDRGDDGWRPPSRQEEPSRGGRYSQPPDDQWRDERGPEGPRGGDDRGGDGYRYRDEPPPADRGYDRGYDRGGDPRDTRGGDPRDRPPSRDWDDRGDDRRISGDREDAGGWTPPPRGSDDREPDNGGGRRQLQNGGEDAPRGRRQLREPRDPLPPDDERRHEEREGTRAAQHAGSLRERYAPR